MQIKKASSTEDIASVEALAHEIWNEYYPSLITQEQVDYMLDKFQTSSAITKQIEEGYLYFLFIQNKKPFGYMSIQKQTNSFFLSKLYIQKSFRRNGFTKKALKFLKELALKQRVTSLYLTVNIGNDIAIKSYEALSFKKSGSIVQDIGNGFVMDDFRYELEF
ncbi:GNAT family N-acetyltransferase [Sulfurimonas aquatica]|uniref:GNAT family N-acetyltransferase n=1 Tax=Sulfurimonas aquatica TaxID=2672570 RepID=A0A975AXW8_9BACT|nr:GNAT family N-acetyltransferase [Sulfurimonas aquatica]QSZ40594.1 GNAT family N-acetyltransferase [Sulfurimonas aquatica]